MVHMVFKHSDWIEMCTDIAWIMAKRKRIRKGRGLMIDFTSFFLGEVGIVVKSVEQAIEILESLEENIDATEVRPEDCKRKPYWYIDGCKLCVTSDYAKVMDHVEKVYTYQTYAFDNQV